MLKDYKMSKNHYSKDQISQLQDYLSKSPALSKRTKEDIKRA